MTPIRTSRTRPVVEAFDLITPAGQVYRFLKPTRFERAGAWLFAVAEPVVLSVIVMGLAYAAGILAEALEPLAVNNCTDQLSGPDRPA